MRRGDLRLLVVTVDNNNNLDRARDGHVRMERKEYSSNRRKLRSTM